MCVLALAWRCHPRFDLVLAGNRDEFHDRPARAADFDPQTGIIGGLDLQAGGRWLGLTAGGRLAVVTNVRRGAPRTAPASRGAIVETFLRSREPAATWLARLEAGQAHYAPFNLLVADEGGGLFWASNVDGGRRQEVEPGLHGLSNAALDTPWPKVLRLRQRLGRALAGLGQEPDPGFVTRMLAALRSRRRAADAALPDTGVGLDRERALSATFVRLGAYGTRCSSLVLRRDDGRWWFIEQRYDAHGRPAGRSLLSGDRHGPRAHGQGAAD